MLSLAIELSSDCAQEGACGKSCAKSGDTTWTWKSTVPVWFGHTAAFKVTTPWRDGPRARKCLSNMEKAAGFGSMSSARLSGLPSSVNTARRALSPLTPPCSWLSLKSPQCAPTCKSSGEVRRKRISCARATGVGVRDLRRGAPCWCLAVAPVSKSAQSSSGTAYVAAGFRAQASLR